tara:strand:- start:7649 stop:8002 length:354 start_codon:yes stop_codon:yes gene_type:complete
MGQLSQSFDTFITRRASIEVKSAAESRSTTGIIATEVVTIKVRFDQETNKIGVGDRITDKASGRVYDIEGVSDLMSMDRVLVLRCKYRSRGEGVEQVINTTAPAATAFPYTLPLTLA